MIKSFLEYLNENIDWNLVKKKAQEVNNFLQWHHNTGKSLFDPQHLPYDCSLEGYCANASLFLRKHLSNHGIHSKFVTGQYRGNDHSWLEAGNHIVDVTAKQFGNPDVHIIGPEHKDYKNYTPQETHIKGIKDVFKNWPEEQRYTKPLRQILKQRFHEFKNKGWE